MSVVPAKVLPQILSGHKGPPVYQNSSRLLKGGCWSYRLILYDFWGNLHPRNSKPRPKVVNLEALYSRKTVLLNKKI